MGVQVENLIHSEPEVVTKGLQDSERRLSLSTGTKKKLSPCAYRIKFQISRQL
jgi:hypothetical protein